jgi:hypothetical protein
MLSWITKIKLEQMAYEATFAAEVCLRRLPTHRPGVDPVA